MLSSIKYVWSLNNITITNDKGRLSQDEIDKMVSDAEKFKEQDEAARKRVDEHNSLESYVFNVKKTSIAF